MDSVSADALAARGQLAAEGWIPRSAEPFRHLPPPDASLWLPEHAGAASAFETGWLLQPGAAAEARWLDATDAAQRRELLEHLPLPAGHAAPYAWAHRALVRDGLRLRVAAAADGAPAWLRLDRRADAPVEAPLLVVDLAPGARCVLVEAHGPGGVGGGVQNLQVHVRLAAGASLQHLRIVQPAAGAQVAHHLHVRLAPDASYQQCLLAGASRYHLQRAEFALEGARAGVRTAAVLLGADAALDHQVEARHGAPHTRSSVDMLALGSGAARLVANARTTIAAGCDEAQVRQRLAGIPTAGQPRLVLRPHLEIHHDQVQAAHGATWGALPEDALFHARQRGLDERSAKALILQGLAAAALARGVDAPVLEAAGLDLRLHDALARHLAGGKEAAHG